eukprot:CAMPEP_0204317436 /NCGR_PEP_ID=MMETSP0469-20131031/5970_1 /ASSEMBLY_ACC=CAM_ASM_000384 /TAXON_ID=2969 /ORGANISM="Oxyrrhis marina" /LENGTH=159 /DNA_ID=CAMNT_0051298357 /DNA_START=10 /DNA_END=489 /DNA_ORIENTATION=+
METVRSPSDAVPACTALNQLVRKARVRWSTRVTVRYNSTNRIPSSDAPTEWSAQQADCTLPRWQCSAGSQGEDFGATLQLDAKEAPTTPEHTSAPCLGWTAPESTIKRAKSGCGSIDARAQHSHALCAAKPTLRHSLSRSRELYKGEFRFAFAPTLSAS